MPTFQRNILSPSSVSPKQWHLPRSLHGTKTHKNIIIIILTAVKTSNNKSYLRKEANCEAQPIKDGQQ
jgi:hypothetical protein